MSTDDLDEAIKSFGASLMALMNNAISEEGKRAGFATAKDFLKSTRYESPHPDYGRSEYYAFALNKLMEMDPRVDRFPPLEFVSTLNRNSSVVDIGAGPVLVIDLYQGEILEELGRLFVKGATEHECGMTALRLLAESYVACGQEALATHVAFHRSALAKLTSPRESTAVDGDEIARIGAVQEVFLLTHEIGHILWSRDQIPQDFVPRAQSWIVADTRMMAQAMSGHIAEDGAQIKRSFHQRSPYAPPHIEATVNHRCDPSSGFIEEVWADFYAWISSMRLFLGNWPANTVYQGLSLALRNLAMIDAIRRLAESATDKETIDEASTRRSVLRLGLRTLMGDLRVNDDFVRTLGLSEDDLSVDFAAIGVKTDRRYEEAIFNPMMASIFLMIRLLPNEEELKSRHMRYEQKLGKNPALKMLSDGAFSSETEDKPDVGS